jgi:hypothetical protein
MWNVLYFLPFEMHVLRYRLSILLPFISKKLELVQLESGYYPRTLVLIQATVICWRVMKDRGSVSVTKVSSNFSRSRSMSYSNLCFLHGV